ncbi:MAG TPA: TetR family transcriptional regulator [Chloroflexaceae bacterium]|nr:TetR family transcriptional regulator [Chloroflexaceae bacterium]
MSSLDTGRTNQKRRTRAAIVAAAAALLQSGQAPTVAEVADAAAVSRATAYRYFPSQELLLAEAALELKVPDIPGYLAAAGDAAEARLDAVVAATLDYVAAHEAAFRGLLRLSLEGPAEPEGTPRRRAGRRLAWAATALEPLAGRLGEEERRRLAAALASFLGIETLVVLKDVCGLDDAEAQAVARWAAQRLLAGAIAEQPGP